MTKSTVTLAVILDGIAAALKARGVEHERKKVPSPRLSLTEDMRSEWSGEEVDGLTVRGLDASRAAWVEDEMTGSVWHRRATGRKVAHVNNGERVVRFPPRKDGTYNFDKMCDALEAWAAVEAERLRVSSIRDVTKNLAAIVRDASRISRAAWHGAEVSVSAADVAGMVRVRFSLHRNLNPFAATDLIERFVDALDRLPGDEK